MWDRNQWASFNNLYSALNYMLIWWMGSIRTKLKLNYQNLNSYVFIYFI